MVTSEKLDGFTSDAEEALTSALNDLDAGRHGFAVTETNEELWQIS
jgi:hypothetical protein